MNNKTYFLLKIDSYFQIKANNPAIIGIKMAMNCKKSPNLFILKQILKTEMPNILHKMKKRGNENKIIKRVIICLTLFRLY
jgi:hypothetical protein